MGKANYFGLPTHHQLTEPRQDFVVDWLGRIVSNCWQFGLGINAIDYYRTFFSM